MTRYEKIVSNVLYATFWMVLFTAAETFIVACFLTVIGETIAIDVKLAAITFLFNYMLAIIVMIGEKYKIIHK